MLVSFEPRVLIRYTLLEAHSPTTLRFRPFLAFRSVNELTHENTRANADMQEEVNGGSVQLYAEYPRLYMQFSKKCTYTHEPHWYRGIEYQKEQERGFEYKEDNLVPGWFEMPMKKGGLKDSAKMALRVVARVLKERFSLNSASMPNLQNMVNSCSGITGAGGFSTSMAASCRWSTMTSR